jgi:hypothetical protein
VAVPEEILDHHSKAAEERAREQFLVRVVETDASLLGVSAPLLAVGRRP